MNSIRSIFVAASFFVTASLAFIGTLFVQPAEAAVQAGVLSCRTGPSVGLILGSVREFQCMFRPSVAGMPRQFYTATIGRVGVDIGVSAGGQLVWAVFAPTVRIGPGDLMGTYVGGSAAVAVGLGAGANVLVGGSANSIALQPLSVEGSVGLGVALGGQGLTLRFVR
jgi:Protein of unknown function (DUF992)